MRGRYKPGDRGVGSLVADQFDASSIVQETHPVQQVPRQEGVDVGKMIKTDDANGLAHGRDAKLDALAVLTRSIIETHGWPTEAAKEAFFAAGYGTAEYLEVIVVITANTLLN